MSFALLCQVSTSVYENTIYSVATVVRIERNVGALYHFSLSCGTAIRRWHSREERMYRGKIIGGVPLLICQEDEGVFSQHLSNSFYATFPSIISCNCRSGPGTRIYFRNFV